MNLIAIIPHRGMFAIEINGEISLIFASFEDANEFIFSPAGAKHIDGIVNPPPKPISCPPPTRLHAAISGIASWLVRNDSKHCGGSKS